MNTMVHSVYPDTVIYIVVPAPDRLLGVLSEPYHRTQGSDRFHMENSSPVFRKDSFLHTAVLLLHCRLPFPDTTFPELHLHILLHRTIALVHQVPVLLHLPMLQSVRYGLNLVLSLLHMQSESLPLSGRPLK